MKKVSEVQGCEGCPHNKVPTIDLVYAAGLIDGEGCFCLTKKTAKGKHYSPAYEGHLVVCMTNEPVINWLHRTFGGWKTTHRKLKSGKQLYRWQALGAHAGCLSLLLSRFLKVKKKQAKLFFRFKRTMSSYKLKITGVKTLRISAKEIKRREMLRLEMRALNA